MRARSDHQRRHQRSAAAVARRRRWLAISAAIVGLLAIHAPGADVAAQERRETAPSPVTSPPPPAPMRRAPDRERPRADGGIEGVYAVEGAAAQVRVARLLGDVYHLQCSEGWEGVGILEGATYRGVFRHRGAAGIPDGTMGEHTIDWTVPENPSVQVSLSSVRPGTTTVRWRRSRGAEGPRAERPAPPKSPPPAAPPPPGRRPEPGEVIATDELPEVLSKVACTAPAGADPGGGTVVVNALVLEDGSVSDTRVVKSLSTVFDEAAVACVRQWRFKPAKSNGAPVATWVAVPIKFDAR